MIARLLRAGVLAAAISACAPGVAHAVPSEPGATGPTQPQGSTPSTSTDCAGGLPLLEQACDAAEAVGGAASTIVGGAVNVPGAAAGAIGGGILDQVTEWMTDAARWVTEKIQAFIEKTTTPELQASWYRDRFDEMAALGGGLAVLVAMIALGSAAWRRDSDALGATFIGMFRAGLGTGMVLALTVLALGVADWISNAVAVDAAGREASAFWGDVSTAWGGDDSAGFGSSAIAFVFAVIQVLAGLAVWLELLLRSAAIYVAVLFMPMALAASIWPKLQAWQSRLVSLLFIMIAMKPAIVVVLSLAGSAAAAGGDVDKDFGLLVAAVMILVLAAFVPWVLMMVISMDGEGAWTARQAAGSMKGVVGAGAGRVGGGLGGAVGRAGGALGGRRVALSGGAPGGAGGGGSRGRGGAGPRGSGPGGGGGAGPRTPPAGGGSGGAEPRSPAAAAGGGSPGGAGPRPAGAVAAAAGLVPPGGGGASRSGGRAGSGAISRDGGGGAGVKPAGRSSSSPVKPAARAERQPGGAPRGASGPRPTPPPHKPSPGPPRGAPRSGPSRQGPSAPGGRPPSR